MKHCVYAELQHQVLTKAEVIRAHDAHFNGIGQLGVIKQQREVACAHRSKLAKNEILTHTLQTKSYAM